MCAAVPSGAYPDLAAASQAMVKVSGRTEPASDRAVRDAYTRKYENYKRAIEALDPYWK
jgi:ribulose kinase